MENKTKTCKFCRETKETSMFLKDRLTCKLCANEERRERYANDNEFRQRVINQVTDFKLQKKEERHAILSAEQEAIGLENKLCKYCNLVKSRERFRYNRRKCADCERDEPLEKFKRSIRSRIYSALVKLKTKHSIEYLGCTAEQYIRWLQFCDPEFSLENREGKYHIDHVIPLCKFNLDDEAEQLIAFNWRNTTCVSAYENLAKNRKIIPSQIETHLKKLQQYHEENEIKLPSTFTNLFAKSLVAGSP